MPKISHLFLIFMTINILTINAMNQQQMLTTLLENKKNIVIALSNNANIKSFLNKNGFDDNNYTIIPIRKPIVTTTYKIKSHLTNEINQVIQNKKIQNPDSKIYFYTDHAFLYSLNYAANNSHTIDGLILNNPDYNITQPFFERIFEDKPSHLIKKIPATIPVIIMTDYNKQNIFYDLLRTANQRTIKNLLNNTTGHNTFLTIANEYSTIASILRNPHDYRNKNWQPTISTIDTINTIKKQDNMAYIALCALKTCGGGLLLFILHKIGTLAMLMRLII